MPIFLTQFLGAFNDNLFKNALVILITYELAAVYGVNGQIMITAVAGIYICPFFLFSSLAGQLADKYEKSFLIKIIKAAEVVIMGFTTVAFYFKNLWCLIILLFFMGAQSTFFGPLKFSILPQHLKKVELVAGNGLISAATYVAILTGTLLGGLLILSHSGTILISVGIISVALAGLLSSLFIPKAEPHDKSISIDFNIVRATWSIVSMVYPKKEIFRALLGISWFWFVGATFLAQCPTFAKDIIGGNEVVSTFFIVLFAIGIGIGSTLCNRILKSKASGKLIVPSSIGMSISIGLLVLFSLGISKSETLIGVASFVSSFESCGIIAMFVLMAVFAGLFNVPLYAIMQSKTPGEQMARSVACLNIMDSFGMVLSAVFSVGLFSCGFSVLGIFAALAAVNLLLLPYFLKIGRG